jgi:hypothetical protein
MPLLLLICHGENDYTKKHKLAGNLPNIHLNEPRAETSAGTDVSWGRKTLIPAIKA